MENKWPREDRDALEELKRRAEKFEGRIVVILPIRNEATPRHEGNKAVRTIRQLRSQKAPRTQLHFVCIDDGSTDGCANTLTRARDITFFRNELPKGQGIARSLGVYVEPATAYVSMDAHMEMRTKHGLEMLALNAIDTGGIVSAASYALNLEVTEKRQYFCGIGQVWRPFSGHQWYPPLKSDWAKTVTRLLQPIDLPQGACYAFTRATFDKLGGFHESHNHFGFFDRDLAINCRFQDIPLLCNTYVQSWHWYRRQRPYRPASHHIWYGYTECLRSMFRDDIWRKYFLPKVQGIHDAGLQYLIHDVRLAELQSLFEKKKKRTDEEVIEWIGL